MQTLRYLLLRAAPNRLASRIWFGIRASYSPTSPIATLLNLEGILLLPFAVPFPPGLVRMNLSDGHPAALF